MGYWRTILAQASKRAADPLRLGSLGSILTLILIAAVGAGISYKAGLWSRIATVIAPFALYPAYFVWFFFSTIRKNDAEREAEILRLNNRVSELEAEGHSDISIYADLNHDIHAHPDHPIMHCYNVVIENTGPNFLTNCVLKISAANKVNLALQDRSWLRDASRTFDLRRGQVERLPILWVEEENLTAPAYPQQYRPNEPDFWPGTEGEILLGDEGHFLFCEILSANTVPARLTLRVWNNGEGWQIEALRPDERPSFDA